MLGLFIIVLSLVLLALAALNVPGHPRFSFFAAGMFFFVLWMFLGSHPHLS